MPNTPSLVETLKRAFGQEGTNLDILKHPLPSWLGVQNKIIPNEVFSLRVKPLFLFEHMIITLNPNNPKSNAMEKVPNVNFLTEFLRNHHPKEGLFHVEVIIISGPDPT